MKELRLPDSLATSLASGHPWVYRDHVGAFSASRGSLVRVRSASFSAIGIWDDESAIAVRIFSTEGALDDAWLLARVQEAWDLRKQVRERGISGYRLIYGEADSLPGIVVDMYGDFAVLVIYSQSLGALGARLAPLIQTVTGCKGVARRIKVDAGSQEHKTSHVELRVLAGEMPPATIEIAEEGGMRLLARLREGQKTGLFFDHRENRHWVREHCGGARVLNLYAYSGGFSVAAALGGAGSVTSVDISKPAILDCDENLKINGLGDFPHRGVVSDVIEFLENARKRSEEYDFIICDPPSFARSKAQVHAAEKAYRKVMSAALSLMAPGGTFCAASCTSQIGPAAFHRAISDAARKARVRFQVIHDVGHAPDHPVLIGHEEGRYLKFVVGRVLRRC